MQVVLGLAIIKLNGWWNNRARRGDRKIICIVLIEEQYKKLIDQFFKPS
jgi:hypothetical protein